MFIHIFKYGADTMSHNMSNPNYLLLLCHYKLYALHIHWTIEVTHIKIQTHCM